MRTPAWLAMLCLGVWNAGALDVQGLKSQLAEGAKVTVVDVRPNKMFVQGHIPGAINIPAALCGQKNLPAMGKVVVYGAGLGREATDQAAAKALAGKAGISVDMLEGGYAAWESSQGLTTKKRGLTPESPNYITYAELKAAKAEAVVLVDLRHPSADKPVTDLGQALPGFQVMTKLQGKKFGASPPLLVLIDNGDGSAVETARTLESGGARRYAILAGGEAILARQGQAGLQRIGSASHSTATTPPGSAIK